MVLSFFKIGSLRLRSAHMACPLSQRAWPGARVARSRGWAQRLLSASACVAAPPCGLGSAPPRRACLHRASLVGLSARGRAGEGPLSGDDSALSTPPSAPSAYYAQLARQATSSLKAVTALSSEVAALSQAAPQALAGSSQSPSFTVPLPPRTPATELAAAQAALDAQEAQLARLEETRLQLLSSKRSAALQPTPPAAPPAPSPSPASRHAAAAQIRAAEAELAALRAEADALAELKRSAALQAAASTQAAAAVLAASSSAARSQAAGAQGLERGWIVAWEVAASQVGATASVLQADSRTGSDRSSATPPAPAPPRALQAAWSVAWDTASAVLQERAQVDAAVRSAALAAPTTPLQARHFTPAGAWRAAWALAAAAAQASIEAAAAADRAAAKAEAHKAELALALLVAQRAAARKAARDAEQGALAARRADAMREQALYQANAFRNSTPHAMVAPSPPRTPVPPPAPPISVPGPKAGRGRWPRSSSGADQSARYIGLALLAAVVAILSRWAGVTPSRKAAAPLSAPPVAVVAPNTQASLPMPSLWVRETTSVVKG